MQKFGVFVAILSAAQAFAATAQTDEDAFVEANILGIFYHELGHAVIDIESVPIFGQEEDAADVFSILFIDWFFEEEAALELAYDVSLGFWGEALMRDAEGFDIAWWGVHGPDEQRFYNTVCLFYGGNPDMRDDFAADMELPEDRADYCPEEHDMAAESWGTILDDMEARSDGAAISFIEGSGFAADIIAAEITLLNDGMQLARPLAVAIRDCGEANAFYDPEAVEIVFCSEFEPYLRELAAVLD
ncbi:hypothetical protein ROE7235_02049 [Roseibaca ekhonensis]|jgi:hypothetical protein|uniref:Metallopeptidase n=1 Tax=Roseinatronobacter ekhonensis TaxID=254356 RepID=A0A3B0M9F7_9RHOB|nr:DUF4344 domain-containing metallopeptidase [Roseibaca ekhonensis]SUZ32293.1 hypothetical protein ROE7235_02049 [Roseibaca ekhonensis]